MPETGCTKPFKPPLARSRRQTTRITPDDHRSLLIDLIIMVQGMPYMDMAPIHPRQLSSHPCCPCAEPAQSSARSHHSSYQRVSDCGNRSADLLQTCYLRCSSALRDAKRPIGKGRQGDPAVTTCAMFVALSAADLLVPDHQPGRSPSLPSGGYVSPHHHPAGIWFIPTDGLTTSGKTRLTVLCMKDAGDFFFARAGGKKFCLTKEIKETIMEPEWRPYTM